MVTAKANAMSRDLKDKLKFRFTTVAEGAAADGNPTVSVGTMGAGSQSAFIKIKCIALIGNDAIGQASREFSPHVVQVVLETSTIANVGLMTEANKGLLMIELMKLGCKIEIYMSANTTAPSAAAIIAANLKASIDPDAQWKSLANS